MSPNGSKVSEQPHPPSLIFQALESNHLSYSLSLSSLFLFYHEESLAANDDSHKFFHAEDLDSIIVRCFAPDKNRFHRSGGLGGISLFEA